MEKDFGEADFAKIGRVYDIGVDRLPEFFKKLSEALNFKLT